MPTRHRVDHAIAACDHVGVVARVDEQTRGHGPIFSVLPWLGVERRVGQEAFGHPEGIGFSDDQVVAEPVDTERAHRVAIAIVADEVPVAASSRESPRLDGARLAAVLEGHRRPASERIEEHGQRGFERERADRSGRRTGSVEAKTPAELQQRGVAAGLIAEEHRADGDVQGRGLFRTEAEIGQEVLVGWDAVSLLAAREVLDDEWDPHGAQRLLVALERAPVRHRFGRVARDLTHQLVTGERTPRVEEAREQVQHPFDPVRSRAHELPRGAAGLEARVATRPAASMPAAAAAWNRIGSTAAGRPIESTSRLCFANSSRTSGGTTATIS